MRTKKIIYMIEFLYKFEILLLNILNLLKIPGFFRLKKSQIPDFSRLLGKVTTLMIF